MKKIHWEIKLAFSLIVLSALLYTLHYFMFHDLHHIIIYLIGDIAFVPLEVLLVTVIIHRWLSGREKRQRMHKLNMVIGSFYSEVGVSLLKIFAEHDTNRQVISDQMRNDELWAGSKFQTRQKLLNSLRFESVIKDQSLSDLRGQLMEKRPFLLGLLGNPNLLEHTAFTDTLWAVFHLTEELAARQSVENLQESDLMHIKGDIHRA